jgi:integrase/recombinase XerD
MKALISIKPILRTDKPLNRENKRPVHLIIYHEGKQMRISTRYFVEEKDWDKINNKVKLCRSSEDDLRFISERIQQIVEDFKSYCRKVELAKGKISREEIKSHFNGSKSETFFEYYERIIKVRRGELKKDSYRIYMTTLRMLKEFRSNIEFSEMDLNFVRQFDNYLRTERENGDGGVFNKHKNLRYVIHQAIEDGLMDKTPYSRFKITRPSERVIALDQEEIERLENLQNFELSIGLRVSLETFLFSCYTGLRFSDVITLEKQHLDFKKQLLKKVQIKTSREVELKLCKKAVTIVSNNIDKNRARVFLSISNAKVNLHLKKLMRLGAISKHLTYHISRHTFATFLSEQGVGIEHISRLMGHASIKETMKYAKPAKNIMSAAIDKFDF